MRKISLISGMFLCLTASPAGGADDIKMQSAHKEQTATGPIAVPATPASLPEMAAFSLTDKDIVSWEESGEGKYFYFTLTPEKNEELATLTEQALGKPLRINLNDHFVVIPEVTTVLNQKNGFVLQVPDKGNRFIIARMLNAAKRKKAATAISINAKKEPAQKEQE